MILKSMSRKTPTFKQLYDYMERGTKDQAFVLTHNLRLSGGLEREAILDQFYENASLLRTSQKQNYLYHEIISLKITKAIEQTRLKRIMFELGRRYVQERAGESLAYGRIHIEPKAEFVNAHVHLMISSNGLDSNRRHRLEKQQFHSIQKELESYVLEQYPELDQKKIYDRSFDKIRATEAEYQLKKRTKQPTQREQIKDLITFILRNSTNRENFQKLCVEKQVTFYRRGQYIGVEKDGKKYRLNKLELEAEYTKFLENLRVQEKLEQKLLLQQKKEAELRPELEPLYESDYVKDRLNKLHKAQVDNELNNQLDPVQKRLEQLKRIRDQQNNSHEMNRD